MGLQIYQKTELAVIKIYEKTQWILDRCSGIITSFADDTLPCSYIEFLAKLVHEELADVVHT